jgi:hypothetical protein
MPERVIELAVPVALERVLQRLSDLGSSINRPCERRLRVGNIEGGGFAVSLARPNAYSQPLTLPRLEAARWPRDRRIYPTQAGLTSGTPICGRPRQPARGLLTALRVNRDVARLSCDSLKPLGDCRVTLEVEAALVGDMRVRIQRDVCDRERASGKKGVLLEVPLHCV